jgi:hypothetical protein
VDLSNLRHLGNPRDVVLLGRILVQLVILKFRTGRMKLTELLGTLEPRGKVEADRDEMEKMVKFADFLLHRVLRSRNPCLLRSLLLYRYLRASGEEVSIVFGVRDGEETLQGHAWILRDVKPLLEEESTGEYEAVYVYP